jgi:hypothetical protein
MSRSMKPYCYGGHHYSSLKVKKWYRVNGNRKTRHRAVLLLRQRHFNADHAVFPHPKLDAFNWFFLT